MRADPIQQRTAPGTAPGDADVVLRARRLTQLGLILVLALVASALNSALNQDLITCACLVLALAFVVLGLLLSRRGHHQAASLVVLWTLACMGAAAMALNQGIYSPGILIFPGILVIASMLVGWRHSLALLVFMLAALTAMTWASMTGFHQFLVRAPSPRHLVYLASILVACALMILLLAGDLRRALRRLHVEMAQGQAHMARLSYLAEHDVLTGLPNALLGRILFDQALATARREGGKVGVLCIGIDNFKSINDSFGRAAGDEFLKQVAERLRSTVRASDAVIRQGGDEFLIVLPGAAEASAVAASAAHVLAAMLASFSLRDVPVASSCSIGAAVFPDEGNDFESLVKKASLAMHHAKDAGRNAVRFFDEAMNADMLEDLNLNTSLRLALERGELALHYQPVLDLESGCLVGAEALLRWQHPQLGMIPPGRFIPLAERSGLIVDIGQWVLDEACKQLRHWQESALAGLVLSVNVSTVQFKRGTIDLVVNQALERHGTQPGNLELEVTESALIHDAETFVATLHRLKGLGVRLAIDDFGTGYSNLSYLQRFDVDKLKIDQSFVRRLSGNEQDQAIVRAIVQMAKSLKLQTTAEGIEEAGTRDMLLALGCGLGQGYLFSRPLPLSQFEIFAAEQRHSGQA